MTIPLHWPHGEDDARFQPSAPVAGSSTVVRPPRVGLGVRKRAPCGATKHGSWHPQGTVVLHGVEPGGPYAAFPFRRILLAVAASESLRDKLAARYDEKASRAGLVRVHAEPSTVSSSPSRLR